MFKLYKYCLYILVPLIKFNLYLRANNNKEDITRISERYGDSTINRPKKSLIWIHAASVGEFNSATGLINKLIKRYNILLTTTTTTAFKFSKKIFGNKIIHQYAPIDHDPWVTKFLDHWKPNIVIWIESDLWPNTLHNINKRKIISILLNLRISPKSFKRWQLFKKNFSQLLKYFDIVFAQSKKDLKIINKLTRKKIYYVGNLKFTSLKRQLNKKRVNDIKKNLKKKKVILIASSHSKEEHLILNNLKETLEKNKNIFLIIAPRHPIRSNEVLQISKKYIARSIVESKKNINSNIRCMICKSLGEMPEYYSLSDIVILGGSFVDMGGHNPIEPARYNCSIITGPSIFNWQNIFQEMSSKNACLICNSPKELNEKVKLILSKNMIEKKFKKKALQYSNQKQNIINDVIKNIKPHLKKIKYD